MLNFVKHRFPILREKNGLPNQIFERFIHITCMEHTLTEDVKRE
jgi:hypothetical protein